MLTYTASGSLKVSRCFFPFALMKCKDYGIMNANAFIIFYLNALADTQIKDLLPAYRAIIP